MLLREALVWRGILTLTALALVGCATTKENRHEGAKNKAPTIVSSYDRSAGSKTAPVSSGQMRTVQETEQMTADLSLKPKAPMAPKKAFLADDLEGRSGAFKNLITVFRSEKPQADSVITIVYDGKPKGPAPTSTKRTSHVRIDVRNACPGAKAAKPVKLKQLWNVYYSPSQAQFTLPVNALENRCQADKMVRIETMGLRCQNVNLSTCLRLDVHEVLEIPLADLTNLETLKANELPGQNTEGLAAAAH